MGNPVEISCGPKKVKKIKKILVRELLAFNAIFLKHSIDVYYHIDWLKYISCLYIEDILKTVYSVWSIFLNSFVV